jgi:hypothetical protein
MRDVLILDLTEMSGANVCIAGIDLKSGTTVRLSSPNPTRNTVRSLRGLVPGDVVRLDWEADRKRHPPHVEDARWNRLTARKIRAMPFSEVSAIVQPQAFDSITGAFGEPWFTSGNGNCAWHPGHGERSLASVIVRYVGIDEDRSRRPRIHLLDAAGKHWHGVPLQDLQAKVHATDCESCAGQYMKNIRDDFAADSAIVRVGLTRPYKHPDHPEACWLQVTNVLARERTHFVGLSAG